jgi:AsmA protein
MKKLLIGVAILIVLIVAAAVIIPPLVPLNAYKAKIATAVKQATGRDLRISGSVHFSLLPSLALEANDVALSNPPGYASPNMVQLKTLDVDLKLLPLLHGAIAVDRLKLVDPAIALEVDKNGHPNWAFAPSPTTPTAPSHAPAPAAPNSGSGFPSLSFADVSIVNGQISYFDQRTGEKRLLSNVNMQLSLPSFAGPFAAKGSAVWNGEKATVTLNVAALGTLQAGGTSPLTISLAATPINVDFQGEATGATLSRLDGMAKLAVPSVRGLAQWLGVPFNPLGTGFGQLTINGKIVKTPTKIAFTNATLVLDSIKATGAVTLDSSGARPYISGRLAVDKLDVNPYLAPAQSSAPTSPPPSSGATPGTSAAPPVKSGGWSDAPIDFSTLKAVNADFDLSANAIIYRKIEIGRSALALHLKNGRLEADLTNMTLYEGKGQGKFVADGSSTVPAVSADFNLSDVAVQPLLRDATGFNHLIGKGSLALDVAGRGKSQREIIGTLNGKGSLDLANGKITGIDLIAFMKKLASTVTGAQGGANETNFGSLTGTYTITNGILHNNDLKLASPELPMTGAGTVNLPLRQVNYKLTPNIAGVVAVPVDITGSWDNLSYRPDVSGLAKGLMNDPGKTLDLLKQQRSGAKNLLKGLFGK